MPEALQAYRIRWALLLGLALSVTYAYCTAERAAHVRFARGRPQRHHRPHNLLPVPATSAIDTALGSHLGGARPLSVCKGSAAAMSSGLKESYSLWAMPKGRLAEQLRSEIAALAERHGAATFPPHVTVLGNIDRPREEAVRLTRELAEQIKTYRINFVDVTSGTFFYQCVYLLVAKEEEPMAAAAAARKVFEHESTSPYMPHLSLLYTDIEEAEREKAAKYERERLYGESSGYDTLLVETGYEVGSLALWYTPTEDKSLASWCLVQEFELS